MTSYEKDKAKLLKEDFSNYGSLSSDDDFEKSSLDDVHIKNNKKTSKRLDCTFVKIFRYGDCLDFVLMFVGILCAAIQGSSFPILSIIFGDMTNAFVQQARDGFLPEPTQNSSINFSGSGFTRKEFDDRMINYSRYYLIIAFAVLISAFLQTLCWELSSERQTYRLRKIFFTQILRQDITWYDQNESGDLAVKLSDDLERIREGTGSKFSLVVQYISTFVSGLLVGLYINWRLTSAILLIGPFLIGTSAYLAKISSSSAAREQLKYSIAGGIAEEVLVNIKTVAAFCKERREIHRYRLALEEGRKLAMQKYLTLSIGLAIVFFVMYASYSFAFWYGTQLVIQGLCSPGSIFTILFSVMAGAFSVGNALPFINSVSVAIGAASTIFTVIDRVPEIDAYSKEGAKPKVTEGRINFKNVSFFYPTRPNVQVLNDLNISIEPGMTVAIVGSSGAGKSTIVELFLRFYDPSEGQITLDNVPLTELNVNWLRNQIGVVAQEPVLFSASIADNIRYGKSDISETDIIEAARLANAHTFISKLPQGYDTQVGDRGSQMSGGQKQRIAIARAIVRNPKILLLDEATSALDSYSEGLVQEALEKAMNGRTTVIIAHRLSTIRNADRIYAMKDGDVVESGSHDELMAKQGLYYSLVLAQTVEKVENNLDPNAWDDNKDNEKKVRNDSLRKYSIASSLNSIAADIYNSDYAEDVASLPEVTVWQLVKLNSKEWGRLVVGILACTITGTIMPAFSIFYTEMFVTFTLNGQDLINSAKFWSFMLMVVAVISGVTLFVQTLCMTSAAEKLVMRMREKAFQNILRQAIGWFDRESSSSGYLITRLARDAPLVKAAAGLRVGHVISATVTMLSALAIAFFFGWKLAMLLVVAVPFIAAAAYQQNMMLRKNQLRDSQLLEQAGRVASESIQNIRTVQALGNEGLFVNQYLGHLEKPHREGKKQAGTYAFVFSLSQAVIYLMYAAAFRYGANLIEVGDMTPSDTYRVFFALAFCAASVGNTLSFLQDYSKAKHAARLMMQLIHRKSDIDPTLPVGKKTTIMGKICFKDVHFTYPSRAEFNVLRGISFTLQPGQTLALVGESGCGKSTVIALLERFYDPVSGVVEVDDCDVRSFNITHLRSHIGLVTQEPNLFDCSIKDNIAYGLTTKCEDENILLQKVVDAAMSANIHNFVSTLPQGYGTMVGERGTQLSGGQKQRIAIARALIRNPKILLLDEATSALDTESEQVVQAALDFARKGRTCIMIAHRLSTIQNADIIAVVHKGQIIESGTHEELINKKNYYYRLTERQQM